MRANVCRCLLVVVLGCNVAAEMIRVKIIKEKQQVALPCPHPVEEEVTWSRETDGNEVDILTADDRDEKHIDDPGKRYSSLGDKSLFINGAVVSDTGTYFCNDEAAVELTVIPSGIEILNVTERARVTLKCSSDVGRSDPMWTRQAKGKKTTVFGQREAEQTPDHSRFQYSPVNKTLTITRVQPDDSGLYYCEGKPVAYLNKIKAAPEQQLIWLLGVFLPLLLVFIILFLTWGHKIRRRGGGEQRETVYAEIPDRSVCEMKQGGSIQQDNTYTLIYDPAPAENHMGVDGSVYCLLENPTAP